MAPTAYTVLGEQAAEVDDVRLEPHGEPRELTDDQVQRLADIGVEVEESTAAGKPKPIDQLRKPEAIARAEAAGLDTDGTLAELVGRLKAHEPAEESPAAGGSSAGDGPGDADEDDDATDGDR